MDLSDFAQYRIPRNNCTDVLFPEFILSPCEFMLQLKLLFVQSNMSLSEIMQILHRHLKTCLIHVILKCKILYPGAPQKSEHENLAIWQQSVRYTNT